MKRAILITLILILLALIFLVTKRFWNSGNHEGESLIVEKDTEAVLPEIAYTVNCGVDEKTLADENAQLSNQLQIRTLDVTTGIRVIPESIEVRQRENKNIVCRFGKEHISEDGIIVISLLDGTYDINVFASDYKHMGSFFALNNDTLNVNFNLDPVNPLQELSTAYIEKLHKNDAMVIVGFIVDGQTGKPLEGVVVYSEDEVGKTISERNGFFQLILPLAERQDETEKRGKLYFEKSQYITEMRHNFDMWPEGDLILQIRLQQGVGVHTDEVLRKRQASHVTLEEMRDREKSK